MTENISSGLDDIVLENAAQNGKKLKGVLRGLYIPYSVYWKGAQIRAYQEESAEKAGLRPKNLTILNAAICGFGTAFLYYHFGEDSLNFFGRHFVHEAAQFLGTTTRDYLYGLSIFGFAQSSFRLGYSVKTGKAIGALSVLAFAGDALTFLHKKYIRGNKPVE